MRLEGLDDSVLDGGDALPRAAGGTAWRAVCDVDDIVPDTGVCALVDGRQIAIVRVGETDELYAVDNFDPFSKAFVLSRGIVGDRAGVPKIASPVFKQSFDLRSGQCLDAPEVVIDVFAVRVRAGVVEVAVSEEQRRP